MNNLNNGQKVGVLTFHRAENYGSVLQAYALQKYLTDKLGIENELIDYIPSGQEEFYKLFVPITNIRNLIGNILKLSIANKYKKRKDAFQGFLNSNLAISKDKYSAFNKNSLLSNQYSLIITGSDQIWNTECADFSWDYLLEDVHGLKKISYAASMGGGKISDYDRYKKCLEEYTSISVREQYASDVINQMFNNEKKIEVSLDPTLLLDKEDYNKIAAPRKIQGDYIFLYSVYHDDKLLHTIRRMKKKWGMPIITLISRNNSYKVLLNGIKLANEEGPEDFLGYIRYAKFVLTNSFHGSVFSMIYGKEFYYLGDYRQDPRLKQLFTKAEIEHVGVTYEELEEQAGNFGLRGECDLSHKIADLRKGSERYLKGALLQE
mgnify:FL=1